MSPASDVRMRIPETMIDQSIETLSLSPGALNGLLVAGFKTLSDLHDLSAEDLTVFNWVGPRRAREIVRAISGLGGSGPPLPTTSHAQEGSASFEVPEHLSRLGLATLGLERVFVGLLAAEDLHVLGDLNGRSRSSILLIDRVGSNRLGQLEEGLEEALRLSPKVLARMSDLASVGATPLGIPVDMLQAISAARSMSDEVRALTTGLSERNASLFLRRIGFGEVGIPTLEVLGEEVGISRERVRQLVDKRSSFLAASGLRLPIASALVQLVVEAGGMVTSRQLIQLAAQSGLEVSDVELPLLAQLGALSLTPPIQWSDEFYVWLTNEGVEKWVETGRLTHQSKGVRRLAGAGFRRVGAVPMAEYLAKSGMGEQQIQDVLAPAGAILRTFLGYLVPDCSKDSSLTRVARKMLAVAGALSLRELHGGLMRERRLRPMPPQGVVRSVLSGHQDFVVSGASVRLAAPIRVEDVLSPAELAGVILLREASGVMHTYEFLDGLVEIGVSSPRAAQILHGGLVASPATGVHVLRGFEPPHGLIERKIRERRDNRSPTVLSTLKDAAGRTVVTYRLSRYNLDGVLPPPSELPTTQEFWDGRDENGTPLKITIRNGFLWGIKQWLMGRGARPGDGVVATFDLSLGRVEFEFVEGASDE